MNRSIAAAGLFAALVFYCPISSASLFSVHDDFENRDPSSDTVGDGWRFFINVFESDERLFGYFGNAPNGPQISAIVSGQGGGDSQGFQQLSVYSDYECCDGGGPGGSPSGHRSPTGLVETNVFLEQIIGADDVGSSWTFSWDAVSGNIEGASQALAFIKVLDPTSGFSSTAFVFADMSSTPDAWTSYALDLNIGDWSGQILQFGFLTNAANFEGSGNFYDNVSFDATVVPVPGAFFLFASGLFALSTAKARRWISMGH